MFFCEDESLSIPEAIRRETRTVLIEKSQDDQQKEIKEYDGIPPCVQDVLDEQKKKKILKRWETLKRITELHDEKILKQQSECLKSKLLEYMRKKILLLDKEERKYWIQKIIRLAFLRNLKQIKDLKHSKKILFARKLKSAKGEEKEQILEKIAQLKNAHEYKELLDVNAILNYKKLKKLQKFDKAKKLDLLIKLKRLKKTESVRKKHECDLKNLRLDRLKQVINLRKDWQLDVIRKLDECIKSLTEEMVLMDDKVKWYDNMLEQLEQERRDLIEEERAKWEKQKIKLTERIQRDELIKSREEKAAYLENCKKEKIKRLWKSQRLKDFLKFLDSRQALAQVDENRFFRKIYNKLIAREKKVVEVDPWKQPPPKDEARTKMDEDKRLNAWVQSIIASNKNKFLHKIKLKKYLELMDVPQLDGFMSSTKRFEGVQHVMCIVRGRIFRNTFPEKTKQFIAKTCTDISIKAMRDIRDIDPDNFLVNIQISTVKHSYIIGTGKEFTLIVQQKYFEPDRPCLEKEDVLCLSKEDKEKILQMVLSRSEGRKVISDRRMAEYAAYLERRPADDLWREFMKGALQQEVPCWLRRPAKENFSSSVVQDEKDSRTSETKSVHPTSTKVAVASGKRMSKAIIQKDSGTGPYYALPQPRHGSLIQRAKLQRQEEARKRPPSPQLE